MVSEKGFDDVKYFGVFLLAGLSDKFVWGLERYCYACFRNIRRLVHISNKLNNLSFWPETLTVTLSRKHGLPFFPVSQTLSCLHIQLSCFHSPLKRLVLFQSYKIFEFNISDRRLSSKNYFYHLSNILANLNDTMIFLFIIKEKKWSKC
jgi:hypothetical protein